MSQEVHAPFSFTTERPSLSKMALLISSVPAISIREPQFPHIPDHMWSC